jgi:hypothetical protein
MSDAEGVMSQAEMLIGRLIDGEASDADRVAFERLAAAEPQLWRRLAQRQEEAAALSARVREATDVALRIEAPGRERARAPAWRAAVSYSGWAGVVLLAAAWGLALLPRGGTGVDPRQAGGLRGQSALPPDALLQAYLEADFIVGEMAPTLLAVEERADGRERLRYLRRIEEWVDVDGPAPVNELQELTVSPAELRRRSPQPPPAPAGPD